MDEPILLQIGTNGSWGKDMNRSILGFRRSKV